MELCKSYKSAGRQGVVSELYSSVRIQNLSLSFAKELDLYFDAVHISSLLLHDHGLMGVASRSLESVEMRRIRVASQMRETNLDPSIMKSTRMYVQAHGAGKSMVYKIVPR